MAIQRRRSAASASAEAAPQQQTSSGAGWARRGKAAIDGAVEAQKNAERKRSAGGSALRFYVKKGEEQDIIILDASMEDGIAFYEHNLQDADGNWSIQEPCIKELGAGPCPICAKHKDSSYTLMLSCLVLKSFTTKKGREIPHSKMLLPVKITQFDLFRQLEAAAKGEGKSLRGMYLVMARSKTDKNAPRIGTPALLEGGKLYDIIPEKQLIEEFGHDAVKSEEGQVIRPANFDITPFDYDKLFPKPDVADIMHRYGGKPSAGSTREVLDEFEQAEKSETPKDEPAAPTRTRRKAAPKTDADDENPFGE